METITQQGETIMKKQLRLTALVLTLCLCLAACGGGSKDPKTETPDEPQILTPDESRQETVNRNTQMLVTDAEPLADMEAAKRERYDNGSYYYMDVAGENALRCISSCYQNTIRDDETEEAYAERRAIGMSVALTPGNPYNLSVGKSEDLTKALGQPVYLVSFLTGSDLNATCWTVYLTRTESYSYQYAFAAASQTSITMEEDILDYFATLKLADMPEQ
jgi:predicted small lipoprotein YifL